MNSNNPEKIESDNYSEWAPYAECRGVDLDIFFPVREDAERAATLICRSCVVKENCLEYAIENKIKEGVWGGATERDRRIILRRRAVVSRRMRTE